MRRPGGLAPSIHPISTTMLGSLIVTQCRQYGAKAGMTRATWRANDVGRSRAQPELLPLPPRVGEVVEGDDGLEAPRRAQREDLGVALERGVVEAARAGLEAGPLDGQPEGVAADGRRAVERLLGIAPKITGDARAVRRGRCPPSRPSCCGARPLR